MAVILKKVKRIAAFAAALLTAAAIPCSTYADDEMIIEIIPETADTIVTVKPEKDKTKISPYIFGINDKENIAGISPTVIKQTGTSLSTYNWETNFSNPGTSGNNSNDISLVDNFPSSKWSSPALYTDSLVTRGMMNNIPVRLVTLQLMGYVSKDSMGIVSDDALSKQTRWCTVQFHKNDTYLNQPDTDDDVVYMDEYVSYLVNRYGSAMEGGINGYFLDSEPDKWAENFSVLGLDQAEILEIIDHHRLADVQTNNPIYVRNEPVGSTNTIIASMFQDRGLMPSAGLAGMMAAAILSDTVMFKSPTCTKRDIAMAERLARMARVSLDDLGRELFAAGAVDGKSAEELLRSDFKEFHIAEQNLGVGQVTCINSEHLMERKDDLLKAMRQMRQEHGYDMVILMLTDVLQEGTQLLYIGSDEVIRNAFAVEPKDNTVFLSGVMSRKKQVIPMLTTLWG